MLIKYVFLVFIGIVKGSEENWKPRSNNSNSNNVKENVSVKGWKRNE
jgi:hypothetical protein